MYPSQRALATTAIVIIGRADGEEEPRLPHAVEVEETSVWRQGHERLDRG